MADIWEKLAEPFDDSVVKWRVGRKQKDNKNRGTALAYVDARIVEDRLDLVVGAECWKDEYLETARGRILCSLSIRKNAESEWITKSDGAGETQVEGDKGAISDALKRAAVKFGIGRYLYAVPTVWVNLDDWGNITPAEIKRLAGVHKQIASKWKDLRGVALPGEDEPAQPDKPTAKQPEPQKGEPADWRDYAAGLKRAILTAPTEQALDEVLDVNRDNMTKLATISQPASDAIKDAINARRATLKEAA